MMAVLSREEHDVARLQARVRAAPGMAGADLASRVTTAKPYEWSLPSWAAAHGHGPVPEVRAHIVVMDFGVKHNILRRLRDAGARCTVLPASTTVAELLSYEPDGVLLSNGPGDPAACEGAILEVRELLATRPSLPVFGICLGHQILCLALGGSTFKLKFGHHGGNHPVRDERTRRVAITAQNHGFAVDLESIARAEGGRVELTQVNLFDGTVAGFRLRDRPVSGVQYHPEDAPGPHDAGALLSGFVREVERASAAR
jgi:carbamoyl-phosphate synthase small subunit